MIGNVVLVKYASNGPQCAIAMESIFREAGAPEGLYANLLISGRYVSALLSDSRIQCASLTGSEEAAEHLQDQVHRAVAAGANVLLWGHRIAGHGAFIEATVLTEIKPGSPISYEEMFGPVSVISRARDEQAATELANDLLFGLGGSVFTRDVERGKRLADKIDTGMVFINHPTWMAPELPFGGLERSGHGRELSGLGIEKFFNKKLSRVSVLSDRC